MSEHVPLLVLFVIIAADKLLPLATAEICILASFL